LFQSSPDSSNPYPIAVIFVLLSKTFEAFAANGVRSILALFLRDSLQFDEEFSTSVLHTFNFFSQFLPIVGAILADSYLGNARTIFMFCIPYAFGYFGLFLGTLPYTFATQ
jgi:dipeptide/tripeptide permease